MGANYTSELISIVHRVPKFIGHKKNFLGSVKMPFTTLKMQKETYTETEKVLTLSHEVLVIPAKVHGSKKHSLQPI